MIEPDEYFKSHAQAFREGLSELSRSDSMVAFRKAASEVSDHIQKIHSYRQELRGRFVHAHKNSKRRPHSKSH